MDHLRLVYEDDVLKLFWDTRAGYHIAEWHGFAKAERLRNASHACVYAARERRCSRWLADLTDFSVVDVEDQHWLVERFYPLLAENGLRHIAVVLPADPVARLSAQKVNDAYVKTGSIEFGYHGARAESALWLASRVD